MYYNSVKFKLVASFLFFLCTALLVTSCKSNTSNPNVSNTELDTSEKNQFKNLFVQSEHPFYYGVASGDPLYDAVIIWSRVEPETDLEPKTVAWEVATDSSFLNIVEDGKLTTSKNMDFTVKVDVKNLNPDTFYFYRFKQGEKFSVIGRTKTASLKSDELRFAIASCANYTKGFFNAYGRIAEENNLNAVIFLGDYIYEYGSPKPEHRIAGRAHIPDYEIKSLSDYRKRYALYHLDKDLKTMHKNHPFISVWDDHEIANNAYKDGAQNHSEDEGDYEVRKNNATKAYYEWMPIRETPNHYRTFNFGNLAQLVMLDERLAGRTQQLGISNPARNNAEHSLLGKEQLNWLEKEISESGSIWNLIGSQVIFSYQKFDNPNRLFNIDSWNGYPADQKRLVDFLRNKKNTIILSGDTHSAWAFETTDNPLLDYDSETSEGAVAVEFAVASVNSGNHNETFSDSLVYEHEKRMSSKELNPHLKYINRRDHGYLLLTLNDTIAKAQYKIVPTNKQKSTKVDVDTTLVVKKGLNKIH